MATDIPPSPPSGLTFYQLLGVDEDASNAEIEKQYRLLVRVYHPDQCNLYNAERITKNLHTAREVLTNPRKRQTYDLKGHEEYTGETADWEPSAECLNKSQNEYNVAWINKKDKNKNVNQTIDLSEPPGEGDSWDFNDLFDSEDVVDHNSVQKPIDTTKNEVTNVDQSFIDQVNTQSSSRDRKVRFSQTRQDRNETTNERDERDGNKGKEANDIDEGTSTIHNVGSKVYTNFDQTLTYIENFFSQDVISTAVRRAWIFRLSVSVVSFTSLLLIGFLLSSSGNMNIQLTPEILIPILIGVTSCVFVYDQYNTEQDVNRGQINVAKYDLKTPIVAFIPYLAGVGLLLSGLYLGGQPVEYLSNIIFGMGIPDSVVWHSNMVVNVILSVVMVVGLLIGYMVFIPLLTRQVWYDRYVNGYRVLPLIWDLMLVIPTFVWLLASIMRVEFVDVPTQIGTFVTMVLGPIAPIIDVTTNTMSMTSIIVSMAVIPIVVTVVYSIRHLLSTMQNSNT